MDLAKQLLRTVMRAFYETRHILVIDALVLHSALRDDDLAYLMSMNTKDLHKLCAFLRDARCLAVHSRPEKASETARPVNRIYYYIDYRQTIDAIKWRVYKMDKDMQGTTVPASEKKEYFCPRCKAEWTQMQVLDNWGPTGFLCHRCGSVLTHDVERQSTGHQKSTRMHNQFKFITDLLPRIDSVFIPDNNFDVAFNSRLKVVRDAQHQIAQTIAVDPARPTAVKGLANTGPTSMSVIVNKGDGPSEEEKEAERLRKEKLAKQNELPAWMERSTIDGASYKVDGTSVGAIRNDTTDVKDPNLKSHVDDQDSSEMASIFARIKEQAAEEAARKARDEEEGVTDDEDEDEDEFEDVDVATGSNSAVGTPASTAGALAPTSVPAVPSPLRQSNLKREASSGDSTPAGGNTPGAEDRPVKKVKVEEPPAAAVKAEEADSDEDDLEFEDV
ncbi:uncharacterized protein E0L32_004682 [Thyridium curvatum]|uniref:HTH TFE/IIEalpha-type domain-containing protein n=1 Tax=Thyridium curvatum TaxID=1093900 RepID=A0A507B932_9PEZI|nr:uncharacterized protein E0L32_004682 [Thyridium curvatum]TPX15124.1 hypothetical protein E0L32_004682 [Thyridium curvatum]